MAGLTPGDRIPDFARPGPEGKPFLFYDVYYGQPIALFVCGRVTDAGTRAELAALDWDDAGWRQVTRVVLVQATPAECAALTAELKPSFTLVADDGALTAHLAGATTGPMTAFVLDENLRVSVRLQRDADAGAFVRTLAGIYAARPTPQPQLLRRQAPVLFIPEVFDKACCDGLIALFEETGGAPSGTAYVHGDKADWKPDPAVKMRRDIYLEDGPWLERVKDALVRRVLPEIQRCFNFQVTQHEVFKVIRYDEGAGYFRPHRDNESRDTQHRRFAMTLNLNTGDYEGGALRFPEFGPDLYVPERGGAVIFSCSLLHEVTPVTRGRRYGLLGFFFGEAQQMNPTDYRPAR
jgi:predicted 2-oxoglutarate/Fe(II)-dependent dioxygenase YbiX